MSKIKIGAVISAVAVAILALYIANPSSYQFWPKCPLKLLTGLDCPSCGIQRFFHAFLHGDFLHAIAYNYYLIYALPYALSFLVAMALPQGKYKNSLKKIIESKPAVWLYVITFFAWLIVRNLYHI